MKKWTVILILIILAISVAACGQKVAPQQAESVAAPQTETPVPQATKQQVMIPIAGGSNSVAAEESVSPVATPVSPVAALKTEIGGETAMDTAKLDDTAAKMVELVTKQLLADNTTLSADDVQVLQATAQQWRDASLGCPRPGMMYAQVITPGYLIEVKAGGKVYEYHTDTGQSVVLCAVDGQAVK